MLDGGGGAWRWCLVGILGIRKWGQEMGTFLVSGYAAGGAQKGMYLFEVCPLLLGNEECPHFPFPIS